MADDYVCKLAAGKRRRYMLQGTLTPALSQRERERTARLAVLAWGVRILFGLRFKLVEYAAHTGNAAERF